MCGYYANPVPLAQQLLQPVAGAGQVSTGQAFQPVVVRVTDLSSPPNSVVAARFCSRPRFCGPEAVLRELGRIPAIR